MESRLVTRVSDYYRARYRALGDTAQGMDWKDEASQHLRFARILRQLDTAGVPSVLDVGCGNGGLLTFLQSQGVAVRYHGIDITAEMVEGCVRRHGPGSATLVATAIPAQEAASYDYVVASGTFNVKLDTPAAAWGRYLRRALCAMYRVSRRAVVFNVMSSWVDHRYDRLYYLDPRAVPGIARRCGAPAFLLDHAYPLHEMTVALLRS